MVTSSRFSQTPLTDMPHPERLHDHASNGMRGQPELTGSLAASAGTWDMRLPDRHDFGQLHTFGSVFRFTHHAHHADG